MFNEEFETIVEDLPKDYMEVNFGPHHPSTHGVFRFIAKIDGERIAGIEPVIGYLHRGLEKMAESRTYIQFKPLVDRLDYTGALLNELCYCQALEKMAEIEVPPRAQAIRVICAELNRICAHLIFFGAMGLEAGAFTPFLFGFAEREKAFQLLEMLAGGRLTFNFITVGGVREDIPAGFKSELDKFINTFPKRLKVFDDLFTGNEIFMQRTRGIGVIKTEDAIDWAMSGPTLRGSGVRFDIRKVEPYSGYEKYDFIIPAGKNGDVYDRYLVRMEEMKQSLRIVEQAAGDLPEGGIQAKTPKVLKLPEGELYYRNEGTKGEIGFYIISNGEKYPYRMKIRTPSFSHLSALDFVLRGSYIADAILIMGSFDTVMGSVDR
ncbi:MAG: NADH-quinone oxidoreductase subunit D [Actinobacteria bacterium]|nr:NADH-quinone oxidoreductase subunit D [Actinomycetota bacterium]